MPEERTETTATPSAERRPRRRPDARLIAVHPPEAAAVIELTGDEVVIGREEGSIQHRTLSRRHLAVRWDSASWARVAVDLGSKNGSAVDSVPLAGAPRVLRDGAVVRAGDVLLVYEEGDLDDQPDLADAVPGQAAPTRQLRVALARAAADPAPVLLLGETGTGKEWIARALHRASGRRGPFLAVSCAELSGELMASQLFGHARGAFTGAEQARPGLFRSAAGGTLLLDEIGELPAPLQPKLLRVLQEGEVLPVGENRPVAVDVRVIAATHAPLEDLVERGGFRRDLYARLAFWVVAVPPLRARRADILDWIARLTSAFADKREKTAAQPMFTPDAAEALLTAPWPENLRGVDRLVHRLASRPAEAGFVGVDEVRPFIEVAAPAPAITSTPAPVRPPAPSKEELEALLARLGSVRAVAKHLGRDRRQIYRWLKAFGLRSTESEE